MSYNIQVQKYVLYTILQECLQFISVFLSPKDMLKNIKTTDNF